MSSTTSLVRSRRLAVGASLLGCSLASTAAFGGNMTLTTLNSFSGTLSANGNAFSASMSTPSSYFAYNAAAQVGAGFGSLSAYGLASGSDIVMFSFWTPGGSASASGVGSMNVTFSSAVKFNDYSGPAGTPSGWSYNSVAMNDGDVFAAGTYTFNFNYSYSGWSTTFLLGATFSAGSPGGVPLPGAAGLAACGLLGMNRRRRR